MELSLDTLGIALAAFILIVFMIGLALRRHMQDMDYRWANAQMCLKLTQDQISDLRLQVRDLKSQLSELKNGSEDGS